MADPSEFKFLLHNDGANALLRNGLLVHVMAALERKEVNIVEAVVACVSTAATCLTTFPPAQHEALPDHLDGVFLKHVNKRPAQIQDGTVERQLYAN